MLGIATKRFDIEEYSTDNLWYRIIVRFRGQVVDDFLCPTWLEARRAYELAGYQTVNLV